MRSLILASSFVIWTLTPVVLNAQEGAPLGKATVSVQLGYIAFPDAPSEADDGVYLALEGYVKIAPNLYLGGMVGSADTTELLSDESTELRFIELNVKYAIEALSNLIVDAGGGVSYSHAEYDNFHLFSSVADEHEEEWLAGGQLFADLIYRINWFSLGINAKYQITEEMSAAGYSYSNFRTGLQVGFIF